MSPSRSTRRPASVPAKGTVPGPVQTPAERRAVEAQWKLLIDRFAPRHRRLISTVRRSLQQRLPTAFELIYEYRDFLVISVSPTVQGYVGLLGLRASAGEVKLYFNRGRELHDPAKLLHGTGTQTRALTLENAATFAQPAVADLIEQAIALNPIPFATTGRGAMLLRSGSKPQVKPRKRSAPKDTPPKARPKGAKSSRKQA